MSTGGSGSGVTRRQLKRAEEGWRLFEAAAGTRAAAVGNMMAAGDVHNALATTEAQEKWGRIADKAVREIGEAVEIMRCGMPYNAKDMGRALSYYGLCLQERGEKHRALPILLEAVDILKRRPEPGERGWGLSVQNAATILGVELWRRGRVEGAAAALEEAVEAVRIAGVWPEDPGPHVMLAELYAAMGRYEKALEKGLETLQLVKPPANPRGHEEEAAVIAMRESQNNITVLAAMADACEGLGKIDKCADLHNTVVALCRGGDIETPPPISVMARCSRLLQEKGDLEQADVRLTNILRVYMAIIKSAEGLACLDGKFLSSMIPPLRRLVEVGRAYGQGREQDAWALEQELDETEAILAALKASALEELRWEIHTAGEDEQGAAAEADRTAREKERKKLTRKQQKRKAAQRRKAEARAEEAAEARAEEAAAAAGAGGGGGGDGGDENKEEGEGDGVDAVTTAAAALQLEGAAGAVEEPEPEPEPGPEPEECAICLNDLEEGTEARLVCTHVFHTGCLERWKDKCMEKSLPFTCAMCRRLVVVVAAGAGVEGAEA